MKRAAERICILLLVAVTVLLGDSHVALAHPKRWQHNKELEQVLFDDSSFSKVHKNDDEGKAVIALETAAYLCIDQYGKSGGKDLSKLDKYGVTGLPNDVSELNPTTYSLIPRTHRSYSHRGWEVEYYPTSENRQRFKTRKSILLNTANVALDYDPWHRLTQTYTKQCDSFCAIIYYVHVLGDYLEDIESDDYKKFNGQGNGIKMAFARANASESNPDMFWEIRKHLEVLFEDQADSLTYKQLMLDLDSLANRSRKIVGTKNGVDNLEDLKAISECVKELMAILGGGYGSYQKANRIHMLLKNEEFFVRAFPSA